MALTTLTAVNLALPGQQFAWHKSPPQTITAWASSWLVAGIPAAGVAPSSGLSGDVPTKATTGAFNFVNPASGNTYLARIAANYSQSGGASAMLAIYDRLWHNSGIDATITTGQTISSVALTRPDANGANVEAWWEVYVVMGAGTPTITLAYTDQDGNTAQAGSSGALVTTMAVGRSGQFQLAAGDTGVRAIATWTANATFTSGTIGLVMRRLVTQVIVPSGFATAFDALATGLPRVYDNACLEVLLLSSSNASATGNASVLFSLAQG